MGSKQTSSQYSFLYSEWLFIERNQRFDIYKQLRNNFQVEVYSLNYISQENLELYERRKLNRHPNVVQLIHFEILSQKDHYFCGKDAYGKIIIERTPFELKEYKRFQNKSLQDIIQQTIRGYQSIYEQYGPLRVQQEMIRFNSEGIIKVWLNTNFSLNEIPKRNLNFDGSQDFVVESILKIFTSIDNTIEICKKVKGFVEALNSIKNKSLIRSVQKKKKIGSSAINNCIRFMTKNPQQQNSLKTESKPLINASNQIITSNLKDLTSNISVNFQKKNASFTYANISKKQVDYITRPSSNIPQPIINNIKYSSTGTRPIQYQYLPRKGINNHLVIQKATSHNVTELHSNKYNSLNTPKASFNLSLNTITPIKRQLSANNEKSINSFTYKRQIVSPISLEQHSEQLSKTQQYQTPRLGISTNKTKFAIFSEQRNIRDSSASPKIQIRNNNEKNSYRNQNNNNAQTSSIIQNNFNHIIFYPNSYHEFTLEQIKQDFLKKNKSTFDKLETIQKILQCNPSSLIKKFCILFKHALTIDPEMYSELQKIHCQFDKIHNQQISERIQKILSIAQYNNYNYSNRPSNTSKAPKNQLNYQSSLPETNINNLNNQKNELRTSNVKRVQSKEELMNQLNRNEKRNPFPGNSNLLFIPGLGVEQVQSILDSNRQLAVAQNTQQQSGKNHKRNKSQTETLIPNEQQEDNFHQIEKQKRMNTQNRQAKSPLNREQYSYHNRPKQEIMIKIKQILAEERQKRINRGLLQSPKEFNVNSKNQQKNSSKLVLFEEYNMNKKDKISTGSINSNHVATSSNNSNYNSGDSSNYINGTMTPKKIDIPLLKDIQKIGRKKSKEISFGKNTYQDINNINNINSPSNKKKINYQDLRNDMQNLLKNSSLKIESKIKTENQAIEEKLKQKKNNFAILKLEAAQVLGL